MNCKDPGGLSLSTNNEEKVQGDSMISNKTVLVEEKTHLVGFPFSTETASLITTALLNQQVFVQVLP